ncbi:hypothetical protein CC2G_005203 [Coprinopsis cinerea AmutBmut pab1-1]|nr:hypothetical protein CC2G_005203 [Coprinopsis cinerea AmutBmut pab1-1]
MAGNNNNNTTKNDSKSDNGKVIPKRFNGNRYHYQAFRDAVDLFFITDDKHDTDQKKIAFVLALLDEGEARIWRTNYLRQCRKNGKLDLGNFDELLKKLDDTFKQPEEEDEALFALNNMKQRPNERAEQTITRFREQASLAGLDLTKNDRIAIDYLKDVLDPEWVKLAIKYDRVYRRNKLLKSLGKRGNTPNFRKTLSAFARSTRNNSERDPDAMDIDAISTDERTRMMKTGSCFYCREQGHIAKECPKKRKDRNSSTSNDTKKKTLEKPPNTSEDSLLNTPQKKKPKSSKLLETPSMKTKTMTKRIFESGAVQSTYASPQLDIYSVLVTEINDHTMRAPITLIGEKTGKTVDTKVLIDSAAGGTFISTRFAKRRNIPLRPLPRPLKVNNVDGTPNKEGAITHFVDSLARLHGRTFRIRWYATEIAHQDLILGLPWLRRANPIIDWKKGTLDWQDKIDPGKIENHLPRTNLSTPNTTTVAVMCLLEDETDEEGETPVVWINAKTTTAQLLAAQEQEKKEKKTIDDILPEPYKKYRHLFEDRPETALPPHRKWDHKIDLKSGFVPKVFKTYQLTPAEDQELQKFLEENLRLGRIRPSQSPMGSPLFFVAKKNGKLRPCQDYRYLNDWTIPNAYPLPRTDELMDRLQGSRYFTKLDIKWGYHNIRIREGDEWKAAFKTNRGLYEPTVMLFGKRNSPATFQNMMNDILDEDDGNPKPLKTEGYMDDLMPHGRTREECRENTLRTLAKLDKYDLPSTSKNAYLKPPKSNTWV